MPKVKSLVSCAAEKVYKDPELLSEYKKKTGHHALWRGLDASLIEYLDLNDFSPVEAIQTIFKAGWDKSDEHQAQVKDVIIRFETQYQKKFNAYVGTPTNVVRTPADEAEMTLWQNTMFAVRSCFTHDSFQYLSKVQLSLQLFLGDVACYPSLSTPIHEILISMAKDEKRGVCNFNTTYAPLLKTIKMQVIKNGTVKFQQLNDDGSVMSAYDLLMRIMATQSRISREYLLRCNPEHFIA